MKLSIRILFAAAALLLASSQALLSQTEISRDSFARPDKIYYPQTWFHYIDGNVDKGGITKDLEAIADAGISGIQLFHGGNFGGDWPGVKDHVYCLSPDWNALVQHTASEAQRLGLKFTMQNCPGWAMSGGPWIEPENAMRYLSWSRTDLQGGGEYRVSLPLPDTATDRETRDYKDIMVIAFPTPDGDTGRPCVPEAVKSDVGTETWAKMLSGVEEGLDLEPAPEGGAHRVEVVYSSPQTLRSLVLSPVQELNHRWCSTPDVAVKVVAYTAEGPVTVLDAQLPMSSWQDNYEMTFALDEATASKYEVYIDNEHDMHIYMLRLLNAARKNSWESEAAWTLRSIPYESENPQQSSSAFIRHEDILDISSCMSEDGTLTWNAPAGKWTVLRIGHVNTLAVNGPAPAEAVGWECDKLSTIGADVHFAGYMKKLIDGPAKGVIASMLMDSWECRTQTWTVEMEKEFRDYNGYDLRGWIPAVFGYVIDDHETTARFLGDWRACIGYLYAYKFYGRMAENAHSNGIEIAYETAAGDIFPADILEYYKFADVPMCEFWNNEDITNYVGAINFKPIKMTASAAHVYGKPRVAAESFTSFELTFEEHLSRLKDIANRHYAMGVTHSVFHTYTHNPCADTMVPGTSFGSGIGTPFLRGQTWWKHMPEFTGYLARMTYMLEQGRPVSDVLWYLGDGSMHKPREDYDFPAGYRYDYCNQDVLLNRLSVKDGKIVTPEGLSYSVIWIEDTHHMLPATAAKLRELVEAGATLISERPQNLGTLVSSKAPRGAHGVQADTYQANIQALWGSGEGRAVRNVGKGRVITGMSIGEALQAAGVAPDVLSAEGGNTEAGWYHRQDDTRDWYFVCSPYELPFRGIIDFNCTGAVSCWDPVSGESHPMPAETDGDHTRISFDLPYAGCCFVVFDHSKPQAAVKAPVEIASLQLDGAWTVSFPEGWGAPASLEVEGLPAWKDMDMSEEGEAFSGTATYTNTVRLRKLDKKAAYVLNLGSVEEIAKVFVNGQEVRTLWSEPYSADITPYLRKGTNEIKVEVTSTWYNRLAYDAAQPEKDRKTWTIGGPEAGAAFKPYGLLGPVSVSVMDTPYSSIGL